MPNESQSVVQASKERLFKINKQKLGLLEKGMELLFNWNYNFSLADSDISTKGRTWATSGLQAVFDSTQATNLKNIVHLFIKKTD